MKRNEATRRTVMGDMASLAAGIFLVGSSKSASCVVGTSLNDAPNGLEHARITNVPAFIARVATYPSVSVTRWHNEAAWGANLTPALLAAVDAIKTGKNPVGKVHIPYRAGGWELASETLLDASWAIYILRGDIRLTATTAQHGLRVTADGTTETPATYLHNVAILGDGKVIIDGGGAGMDFDEPVPGTVPDYSGLRCVGVRGLYVRGIKATNGPMSSMSVKQCPEHLIEDIEFSNARYDNGFSATSDPAGYDENDPEMWGGGTLRHFKAYNNNDFGATAYNCTGQEIIHGDCYGNRGGISYEHAYRVTDGVKNYRGLIDHVRCYNNLQRGIYVDASGVTVGNCTETWGNGGTEEADPNYLFGYGIVISSVRDGYVGGRHHNNEKGGVLLVNASSTPMHVTLAAKCNDNGWVGCYARAQKMLHVLPQAEFCGNGADYTAAAGAAFAGHGLYAVTNSSSEAPMYKQGVVRIEAAKFSNNAYRAIYVAGYQEVVLLGPWGNDNFSMKVAGAGSAIKLENISTVSSSDVDMNSKISRQNFVLEIRSTVSISCVRNTRGQYSTALISNRAAVVD